MGRLSPLQVKKTYGSSKNTYYFKRVINEFRQVDLYFSYDFFY